MGSCWKMTGPSFIPSQPLPFFLSIYQRVTASAANPSPHPGQSLPQTYIKIALSDSTKLLTSRHHQQRFRGIFAIPTRENRMHATVRLESYSFERAPACGLDLGRWRAHTKCHRGYFVASWLHPSEKSD